MRVSVIIPLYNKAPYLTKALDSVIAQTYTDYECIIVNDGSTDVSEVIVESWLSAHTNTSFTLLNQSNSGVAAARNNGVAASTGELVTFLDADDWWEPNFLEEMVRLASEYPDAGIWASNYIYYKPGKTRVGVTQPTRSGYFNYPKAYYEGTGMPITSITAMMPRRVFDEMGGFPVGIRLGEDFLLWSKVALKYKVAFLNKPLAYYNNAIPTSARATRNLHAPEYHMIWHMEHLTEAEKTNNDWNTLIDKLRVWGLLDYWLDDRYHEAAKRELDKVDWRRHPKSIIRQYHSPVFIVRGIRSLKKMAFYIKSKWKLKRKFMVVESSNKG